MALYNQEKPKILSKLCPGTVEEYLEDYFHVDKTRQKELETLKAFCTEIQGEERLVHHILFKIVQYETSHNIIGAALQTLPKNMQTYIRLKYKEHLDTVGLAQAVQYSSAQLNKLNKKFLDRTWANIHYQLTREDIYFRNTIVNMKESLASFLEILQEIEPDFASSDNYYYHGMSYYYNNYCHLLEHLDECILNPEGNPERIIVKTFVENPFETKETIAIMCGCKGSAVTHALDSFEKSVAKYYCAL